MRIFGFRPLGLSRALRKGAAPTVIAASRLEPEAMGYEAADAAAVKRRTGFVAGDRRGPGRPDIEKILRSGA